MNDDGHEASGMDGLIPPPGRVRTEDQPLC